MQDHTKLQVFVMADELVPEVYRRTESFPSTERFGLQSQIRRAAVSVATNIVEGCGRRTGRELLNFLTIAHGSAAETKYLIQLSRRLGFLDEEGSNDVAARYEKVLRALGLIRKIESPEIDTGKS